jgi:small subunit ribosomal protein S19
MARSLKKWLYVNPRILKKVEDMKSSGNKKIIKIRDRSSQISPEMIDFTFAVHNGKTFVTVYVNEEMIGHRFGEFAATRLFRWHPF